MKPQTQNDLAQAIREVLISPNESDRNLEAANIVDAMFYVGRALNGVAAALRDLGNENASMQKIGDAIEAAGSNIAQGANIGLSEIAGAIRSGGDQ